jgi:hypothetical protein
MMCAHGDLKRFNLGQSISISKTFSILVLRIFTFQLTDSSPQYMLSFDLNRFKAAISY